MNIRTTILVLTTGLLAGAAAGAAADTIVLRSGESVEGTFRGASATSLHVETAGGMSRVPIADVASVRFEIRSVDEQRDVRARGARAVIVGADSELEVDLPSPVRNGTVEPGEPFTAALARDLTAGSVLAAPAGTPVHGEVVGVGGGRMVLAINGMEVGGEQIPIRLRTFSFPVDDVPNGSVSFRVQQPFAVRVPSP